MKTFLTINGFTIWTNRIEVVTDPEEFINFTVGGSYMQMFEIHLISQTIIQVMAIVDKEKKSENSVNETRDDAKEMS